MALEVRILSGARAGQVESFEKPTVVVGRHTGTDLRFDPQQDLDVSGRHAEFRGGSGGGYEIHDTGSTNGTFLNGAKVEGSARLKSGDKIQFGAKGPEVEVHFGTTGVAQARTTEERVAFAVKQQTAGLRLYLIAAIGIVAVGVAVAYFVGQRGVSRQVEQLQQQLAQNDALVRSFQSGMPGDTALGNEMQRRLSALRAQLAGATSERQRDSISNAISRIEGRLAGIIQMDLPTINARNAPAVAMLISRIAGKSFAGTAFAITPEGLMLTNRHNVRNVDDGTRADKLAVKFRDSRDWLPAHIVKISDDADVDLALIQMDVPGTTFATVTGIQSRDDNAGEGASVAIIGFPFGYETAQEGEGENFMAKTTLNGGTVSKRTSAILQIDSFAGHGSSGSPVFSARGTVVGVVYGGQAEAGGRIVYAVPPERIAAFLPPEYRSVIKN